MAQRKKNTSRLTQFLFLLAITGSFIQAHAQTMPVSSEKYSTEMPSRTDSMSNTEHIIDTSLLPSIPNFKTSSRIKEGEPLHPFVQFMRDLETNNRNINAFKDFTVGFYLYTVNADDKTLPEKDLMSLAARFSIPYEEIALLNNLTPNDDLVGRTLVIPNAPGLFVPINPKSSTDTLVKKRLYNPDAGNIYIIDGEPFQYHSKERVTPTERAFFLDTNLRMPLDNSVLTSGYGKRVSPITGREHLHRGIDLAAPEGTKVYACQAGTVSVATTDAIYGNYIILQHENSIQSVYAHLSSMEVKTGDSVLKGSVIGRVGSTGASTGPHLHFEIRKNGRHQDPKTLLPAI